MAGLVLTLFVLYLAFAVGANTPAKALDRLLGRLSSPQGFTRKLFQYCRSLGIVIMTRRTVLLRATMAALLLSFGGVALAADIQCQPAVTCYSTDSIDL
jgi:hypothetical protein